LTLVKKGAKNEKQEQHKKNRPVADRAIIAGFCGTGPAGILA
jgi:hypothetical protein